MRALAPEESASGLPLIAFDKLPPEMPSHSPLRTQVPARPESAQRGVVLCRPYRHPPSGLGHAHRRRVASRACRVHRACAPGSSYAEGRSGRHPALIHSCRRPRPALIHSYRRPRPALIHSCRRPLRALARAPFISYHPTPLGAPRCTCRQADARRAARRLGRRHDGPGGHPSSRGQPELQLLPCATPPPSHSHQPSRRPALSFTPAIEAPRPLIHTSHRGAPPARWRSAAYCLPALRPHQRPLRRCDL